MQCSICGSEMQLSRTNLPIKISYRTIVIVKGLPVAQCAGCTEYLIDDNVLVRVEELLSCVDPQVELEIIPFAA